MLKLLSMVALATILSAGWSAKAQITIDTTLPTDWKISNGSITLDWNSTTGNVFGVHMAGYPDNLVDLTQVSHGQPKGLYMDNAGVGSGATSAGYYQGDSYLDWWITTTSNASNAFTYSQHFILSAHGSGFHVYLVTKHAPTDIAGALGQIQWVFRVNQDLFTHSYAVNTALNDPGPEQVGIPYNVLGISDPGRNVQDATLDLHGLALPSDFSRLFYTKYDYSSYEYLHRAHGVYGSTFGAWTVIPRADTLAGGPTKQDLIFTGNILMMEALSGHLDNALSYTLPAGVYGSRIFGPYYFHFNAFSPSMPDPTALYDDAIRAAASADLIYDADRVLQDNGYVISRKRGAAKLSGDQACRLADKSCWFVLSDEYKNFQYSSIGHQYWAEDRGTELQIDGIVPGTYRLSAYRLGEWGETRVDGVKVFGGPQPNLHVITFTPENFGSAPPIWTIGKPDRSAHEFLHGTNAQGADDRQYWGNWNYWADFEPTGGAVNYYATAVGFIPATNDLSKWNYVQWGQFNPGLYAGIYNPSDDTTDGYKYIVPAYVSNASTMAVPAWQVHFTVTPAQLQQGRFAVLSVGLAAAESSLIVSLNGSTPLIWHLTKASDPGVRSGLAGTYQWIVFQFETAQLSPNGENVVTFQVNRPQGVMYDALRLEITDSSADPALTGWNDYEFLYGNVYKPANDAVSNR